MYKIDDIEYRLTAIENRFGDLGYDFKKIVTSELKRRWRHISQNESYFGLYTALCIDTQDPYQQGRVRFFSPVFNEVDAPIESLDWAYPITPMGGLDDSGLVWVPPVGTTLCIIFERGSRDAPYYIGTTWHRDRGPDGEHIWDFNIKEYYDLYEGHRKGYLIPPNDGSQVMPPWNTDNYEEIDQPKLVGPPKTNKFASPNQYGYKTPQKAMVKHVDGNKEKDYKFKRTEILSSCGNGMLFKDDPMNKSIDCIHPDKGGSNEYFKHENECRPFKGPDTPQNNKYSLNNTGVQIISCSGHTIILDDKISGEGEIPEWEKSIEPFNFGDLYQGKLKIISTTGHRIELSDEEDVPENRGKNNYIRLLSACGNCIELNDHTVDSTSAGSERGIHIISTSKHTFEMIDEENTQASPAREEIDKPDDEAEANIDREDRPVSQAKKAFVRIRTGYGLELMMSDDNSQEETKQQYIQIYCPFTTSQEDGPHIMRFQEGSGGNGYVFLMVGGYYLCYTKKDNISIVGEEKDPSDWIVVVSKNSFIISKESYINVSKSHLFLADEAIYLLAGHDNFEYNPKGDPYMYPVMCLGKNGIVFSDRVYVSASDAAQLAPVFLMSPFAKG
jgi:hypothetical protein